MGKRRPQRAADLRLEQLAVGPGVAGHEQGIAAAGFVEHIVLMIMNARNHLAAPVNTLERGGEIGGERAVLRFADIGKQLLMQQRCDFIGNHSRGSPNTRGSGRKIAGNVKYFAGIAVFSAVITNQRGVGGHGLSYDDMKKKRSKLR